jgi:methylglutaconyl-CoA hydratase
MPNPIADPLVENVDTDSKSRLVLVDATPAGVATVTLNRADHGNAFNAEMIGALREAFETLEGADGVRVVFVTAPGGAFSAGVDREWVRDAADYTEADHREDALSMGKMLQLLHELPILTVAVVEGDAVGAGVGLVAACDMAVAVSGARFAFPDVKFGLLAGAVSPYVVAAIGPRRAKALFALGRSFGAAEALRIGLLDQIVDGIAALAELKQAIVKDIVSSGAGAVGEAKRLVDAVAHHSIDHGLLIETAHRTARVRVSSEGREGVAAYLEGRPPLWSATGDDGYPA